MLIRSLRNALRNGLPSALLEVALIFLGITLAIGFDNWNSERKERAEELALLVELKSNFDENLILLANNTSFNEQTAASIKLVIAHRT